MYKSDTVRLVVDFKDFDGNTVIPENVKLTIYDKQELMIETITEGIVNPSSGNYFYDYTADSDFVFEFSGIYFGKPIISRQAVPVKFN